MIARFSSFSLAKQLNICLLWCSTPPPVTIIKSSRKLNVFVKRYNVLSIAFWNSAGISVRPQKPVLNLYVPVAWPPILLKLHWQCLHLMVAGYRRSVGQMLKIALVLHGTIAWWSMQCCQWGSWRSAFDVCFCGLPCLSFWSPLLVLSICFCSLKRLLGICKIRHCIFLIWLYDHCFVNLLSLLRLVFLNVAVRVFPFDGQGWSYFQIGILLYDVLTVRNLLLGFCILLLLLIWLCMFCRLNLHSYLLSLGRHFVAGWTSWVHHHSELTMAVLYVQFRRGSSDVCGVHHV